MNKSAFNTKGVIWKELTDLPYYQKIGRMRTCNDVFLPRKGRGGSRVLAKDLQTVMNEVNLNMGGKVPKRGVT